MSYKSRGHKRIAMDNLRAASSAKFSASFIYNMVKFDPIEAVTIKDAKEQIISGKFLGLYAIFPHGTYKTIFRAV